MRQFLFVLALLALSLSSDSKAAAAASSAILDQENIAYSTPSNASALSVDGQFAVSQVVTVGRSGHLARVELGVYRAPAHLEPLSVSILKVGQDGLPDMLSTGVLANRLIAATTINTIQRPASFNVAVDFAGSSLAFESGQRFAILLESKAAPDFGGYGWWHNTDNTNTYIGGAVHGFAYADRRLISLGTDAQFRTFLTVPEPSAITISGLALVALAALRYRK